MFYEPFSKCVARFPNILFLTVHSAIVVSADHPIFLKDDVFIFGVYQGGLDVLPPLRCISIPYFLQMFLQFSLIPFTYGTTM